MSLKNDMTPGPHETEYWYNTSTHLWGPYKTREEAEHAMETAQKRNEEWDNQWKD